METNKQDYYEPGPGIGRMELARAYVPYQRFDETYSPEEALMKGTYFPELWRPYRHNRM